MDTQAILSAAEMLLTRHFEASIRLRLEPIAQTGKSVALRGYLQNPPPGIPATVFLKHHSVPEKEGARRLEQVEQNRERLFNDWAACLLLNRIERVPPLAPLLFGGDEAENLLVLEDLGAGTEPNTNDMLNGSDPDLAAAALREGCALLGKLHGATLGRADEYQTIRSSLEPPSSPTLLFKEPWSNALRRQSEAAELAQVAQVYFAQCRGIGLALPNKHREEIAGEIAQVAALVEEEPGPYLAFCKGDQNMAGDFLRCDGQPRIFDFDASGFRHALIEGMPGRMTWGCMMRLPAHLQPAMETAYRQELAQWLPEAADDAAFHRAMVDAGARWHIFHVIERVAPALTADWQRGPTTGRQQVLAWLDAFANLSEEFGRWPALGRSAREMSQRLQSVWPEVAPLPYYPAFARLEGTRL